MSKTPVAIIRISGLSQKSTVLIYDNTREARKYFSYLLHDNHNYSKGEAQQAASSLENGDIFVAGDTTYWISDVIDTRSI